MQLQRYELDWHPGLVATSSNCFSVSRTFKFHTEINRHQISKHQQGGLWATTDDGSDSTLTISILLSETNFPVWIHKAVSKFVKSFQKFNFKVLGPFSTNSTSIVNFPYLGLNMYNAVTTRLNNLVRNPLNAQPISGSVKE